jgi:hypothetical protein
MLGLLSLLRHSLMLKTAGPTLAELQGCGDPRATRGELTGSHKHCRLNKHPQESAAVEIRFFRRRPFSQDSTQSSTLRKV